MIIIETCPVCGHDLQHTMLTTYPGISRVFCISCGWSSDDKPEKIIRVPYGISNREDGKKNFLPHTIKYEKGEHEFDLSSPYCPECGHTLERGAYTTDPPIPYVRCNACGFEREKNPFNVSSVVQTELGYDGLTYALSVSDGSISSANTGDTNNFCTVAKVIKPGASFKTPGGGL